LLIFFSQRHREHRGYDKNAYYILTLLGKMCILEPEGESALKKSGKENVK
jgi:hypothetical protein